MNPSDFSREDCEHFRAGFAHLMRAMALLQAASSCDPDDDPAGFREDADEQLAKAFYELWYMDNAVFAWMRDHAAG